MNKSKNNLSEAEREAFAMVGRIGGKATFQRHGKKHMQKIGRAAAKARWANKDN